MSQLKLTARQRTLLDVFEKAQRPLTAHAAWTEAGQDVMSLATVYRAIQRLVEAGAIHPLDISNAPPMWEAVSIGHHHHFYCTKCQQVYKIPKCVPKLDTLVPAGFTMSDHSITIYGICAECGKAP